MSPGLRNCQQICILMELARRVEPKLYVTGSNFSGNPGPGSDIDLFCGMDGAASQILSDIGFKIILVKGGGVIGEADCLDKPVYHTKDTLEVWRHECGIDIQIVENPERKNQIQHAVKKAGLWSCYFPSGIKNKSYCRDSWNFLLKHFKD